MKYVILHIKLAGTSRAIPVIFPQELCHDIVAEAMQRVLQLHDYRDAAVVSAGDVHLLGRVSIDGSSKTLSVPARVEQDALIISTYDYQHGVV